MKEKLIASLTYISIQDRYCVGYSIISYKAPLLPKFWAEINKWLLLLLLPPPTKHLALNGVVAFSVRKRLLDHTLPFTVLQLCAILDMIKGCNEDFLLWFCVGSPDSKSPFLHPANLCRNVSWLRSINSSVIVLVWFLITSFRITAWIGSIYIIINSTKQHDTDVLAVPFMHCTRFSLG